ncbi:hypothetical protein PINS_up001728 [Pythium insidiosum]|nr:hypothetical protein PINS_up001728 [Pythium insidiosum]
MGAASSTRKLAIDCMVLQETLEPNAQEIRDKANVRDRIQDLVTSTWPTCQVIPFGSSVSGLGCGGSDLDLGIFFDDLCAQSQLSQHERIEILAIVYQLVVKEFEVKEFVQHARIPVLKLWDPVSKVACDVCVGNVHVLLNTAMLKHYCDTDPRVRPLAFAVKHWAKQRGINDSVNGTLSSYGFILLLVFYLQSSGAHSVLPPVESVFYSILAETSISNVMRRLRKISAVGKTSTFGTALHESVGALLHGFFRFYATEFDMGSDVVSVRLGSPIAKTARWNRAVPWRFSIEDPFELSHDVGRVIFCNQAQELITREFRRANDMVSRGLRFEEVCCRDESVWNWVASCYLCGSSDHSARHCSSIDFNRSGALKSSDCIQVGGVLQPDCWYCGELGHVKSTCPLFAFVNVRHPSEVSPLSVVCSSNPTAALPFHQYNASSEISRARAASISGRQTKKKKRPRNGSISSLASSPEQERSRKYILAASHLYTASQKCGHVPRRDRRGNKATGIRCVT